MDVMIRVKDILHKYPDKTEVLLEGLEFTVHKGERVALIGPNGTGKTTLMSLILGLLTPRKGFVEVLGCKPHRNFNTIRNNIGVVFQNVDEQIIGPTVFDDIAFSLRNKKMREEDIKLEVLELAKKLNIDNLLNKIPHYLSGGQKKKIAIAGAIVAKPRILILDEPFESMDSKTKMEILTLLNKLNKEYGMTIVITTHNIDLVSKIADTVYLIYNQKIAAKGTPQEIFKQTELIKEANLELPILVGLFTRLREKGYLVDIPLNIEEAEAEIINLLNMNLEQAKFL